MSKSIQFKMGRRGFLSGLSAGGLSPRFLRGALPHSRFLLSPNTDLEAHDLRRAQPSPDFFEGMLLGNGDLGLCVTLRPDALVIHLGKNDVWDIRVNEEHMEHVLPFDQLMSFFDRLSRETTAQGVLEAPFTLEHPEYTQYQEKVVSSYRKPWPRPWPCGQVIIHWDPRKVDLIEQELNLYDGLYTARFDIQGRSEKSLRCLVHRRINGVVLWAENERGEPSDFPVKSIGYYAHQDSQTGMPAPELSLQTQPASQFKLVQRLPFLPPSMEELGDLEMVWGRVARDHRVRIDPAGPHPQDEYCSVTGALEGNWLQRETDGGTSLLDEPIQLVPRTVDAFNLKLQVEKSRRAEDAAASRTWIMQPEPAREIQQQSRRAWDEFWSRSRVRLSDPFLEEIWYRNQYWLACAVEAGKTAPGLFGNWMSGNIGTAWHGDYHMNYNTQQVFWGCLSSNHPEQNLSYLDLCWHLLPIAQNTARDLFGLPGAYFPHSAYPVPSEVNPYPAPPWGYELCETPWTVQGAWWHYLYTQDLELLRDRIYPLLREAVTFCTAFLEKGADGRYHAPLSVSPEKYGITVNLRYNHDVIIDTALLQFLYKSILEASDLLNEDLDQREGWADILAHLPDYPRAAGETGEIWTDVADGPADTVYNVPVSLAPVFPGEQVGLHSTPDLLALARRTAENVRLEGGNDLVFINLIRARLGILDLEEFKEEIRYCMLPNGTCTDRVRQVGGRYTDKTDFDFMADMGIWIENLALPAVLNECLMQSYNGIIRLFPNPGALRSASFEKLRAVGAFLVSASWEDRVITDAVIESLAGKTCRIYCSRPDHLKVLDAPNSSGIEVQRFSDYCEFETEEGRSYRLQGL